MDMGQGRVPGSGRGFGAVPALDTEPPPFSPAPPQRPPSTHVQPQNTPQPNPSHSQVFVKVLGKGDKLADIDTARAMGVLLQQMQVRSGAGVAYDGPPGVRAWGLLCSTGS